MNGGHLLSRIKLSAWCLFPLQKFSRTIISLSLNRPWNSSLNALTFAKIKEQVKSKQTRKLCKLFLLITIQVISMKPVPIKRFSELFTLNTLSSNAFLMENGTEALPFQKQVELWIPIKNTLEGRLGQRNCLNKPSMWPGPQGCRRRTGNNIPLS